MEKYLVLLRGINVGGKNIIKMTDLKDCFENEGFESVNTYIQSGNVVFQTQKTDLKRLEFIIEKALEKHFSMVLSVVVVSFEHLARIIKEKPQDFGEKSQEFRYDVWFLKPPLTANDIVGKFPLKKDIDWLFEGEGVIYAKRLIARVSQSYMSKLTQFPFYKQITIRNWNTTRHLLEILDEK